MKKNVLAALGGIFGLTPHKGASKNINDTTDYIENNSSYSDNSLDIYAIFSVRKPVTIEAEITSSGEAFAFACINQARVFIPATVRVDGGNWWSVRPGCRVLLSVVLDRNGRGLRALGGTFIDEAEE